MGLFKKKKAKVGTIPELPEAPKFPEIPIESKEQKPGQFIKDVPPSTPSYIPFQEEIKPEEPIVEQEKIQESVISKAPQISFSQTKLEKPVRTVEPIFVKVSKVKDVLNSLDIINKKLQDLTRDLDRIRETRKKEEHEIAIWEKQILDIKNKISIIEKKLFGKE